MTVWDRQKVGVSQQMQTFVGHPLPALLQSLQQHVSACCRDTILEFISSTFPGQLYPMYAEKIAKNQFHLSPDVPGARVEGERGTGSAIYAVFNTCCTSAMCLPDQCLGRKMTCTLPFVVRWPERCGPHSASGRGLWRTVATWQDHVGPSERSW